MVKKTQGNAPKIDRNRKKHRLSTRITKLMRGQPIAPPPGLWRDVCIQNVPVVGPIKLQQRFMGFNEDGLPACHTGEVKSKSQKKSRRVYLCTLFIPHTINKINHFLPLYFCSNKPIVDTNI